MNAYCNQKRSREFAHNFPAAQSQSRNLRNNENRPCLQSGRKMPFRIVEKKRRRRKRKTALLAWRACTAIFPVRSANNKRTNRSRQVFISTYQVRKYFCRYEIYKVPWPSFRGKRDYSSLEHWFSFRL